MLNLLLKIRCIYNLYMKYLTYKLNTKIDLDVQKEKTMSMYEKQLNNY